MVRCGLERGSQKPSTSRLTALFLHLPQVIPSSCAWLSLLLMLSSAIFFLYFSMTSRPLACIYGFLTHGIWLVSPQYSPWSILYKSMASFFPDDITICSNRLSQKSGNHYPLLLLMQWVPSLVSSPSQLILDSTRSEPRLDFLNPSVNWTLFSPSLPVRLS